MAKSKDGVILTGDGRCDSPGYSAKFGSYTVIEQQINRVLDFQLVQVSEGMLPFNWISARKWLSSLKLSYIWSSGLIHLLSNRTSPQK